MELNDLPPEIIVNIIQYTDDDTIYNLGLVCRYFHDVCENESNRKVSKVIGRKIEHDCLWVLKNQDTTNYTSLKKIVVEYHFMANKDKLSYNFNIDNIYYVDNVELYKWWKTNQTLNDHIYKMISYKSENLLIHVLTFEYLRNNYSIIYSIIAVNMIRVTEYILSIYNPDYLYDNIKMDMLSCSIRNGLDAIFNILLYTFKFTFMTPLCMLQSIASSGTVKMMLSVMTLGNLSAKSIKIHNEILLTNAITYRNLDVVKFLIKDMKFDPNRNDSEPLKLACTCTRGFDIVMLLVELGADSSLLATHHKSYYSAIHNDDTKLLDYLIGISRDILNTDVNRLQLLMSASQRSFPHRSEKNTKHLIENNYCNLQDCLSSVYIEHLMNLRKFDTIKYLVEAGLEYKGYEKHVIKAAIRLRDSDMFFKLINDDCMVNAVDGDDVIDLYCYCCCYGRSHRKRYLGSMLEYLLMNITYDKSLIRFFNNNIKTIIKSEYIKIINDKMENHWISEYSFMFLIQ